MDIEWWTMIGSVGAMLAGIATFVGLFNKPIVAFGKWIGGVFTSVQDLNEQGRNGAPPRPRTAIIIAIGVLLNGIGVFIGATSGLWVWLGGYLGLVDPPGSVRPVPAPTETVSQRLPADPCAPYLRQARGADLEGIWSGVGWDGGNETVVVKDRDVSASSGGTGKWLRRSGFLYWTDSDGYKFKARIFGETLCGTRTNAKGAPRGVFVLHREKSTPVAAPTPTIEANTIQ